MVQALYDTWARPFHTPHLSGATRYQNTVRCLPDCCRSIAGISNNTHAPTASTTPWQGKLTALLIPMQLLLVGPPGGALPAGPESTDGVTPPMRNARHRHFKPVPKVRGRVLWGNAGS